MRFAAFLAALLVFGLDPAASAAPAKGTKAKAAKAAPPAKSDEQIRLEGLAAAADQGETEAQYQLGLAYRDGAGVKASAAVARNWFELAGAAGHRAAAIEAAKAYEAGHGARRDLAEAGRWWHHAARLGDDGARERWIELVLEGEVTALGGDPGLDWLARRAEAGDGAAAMVLGEAFDGDMDIAADPERAEYWYGLAARLHGDVEAEYRLGRINLHRKAAWRLPSQEEWDRKEAERKGRPYGPVWYPSKPAIADDKAVQLRPGIVDAVRFLESAARRGHGEAQFLLGKSMIEGVELPFDLQAGLVWLQAAAAQGHAEAALILAGFAADGLGLFGKDPIRAFVLYDLAKSLGDARAVAARDAAAKALSPKQMTRARQIVQEIRQLQGM